MDEARLPKSKMGRMETRNYVKWVTGEIERDVGAFEGFRKEFGKGRWIIETRERFLRWCQSKSGAGERGRRGEEREASEGWVWEDGHRIDRGSGCWCVAGSLFPYYG